MSGPSPVRVLFELRPALEGHAGIPLETRLLFRALRGLDAVQVDGLLQSASRLLAPGLAPADSAGVQPRPDEVTARMGRVILSLDRARGWRGDLAAALETIRMAVGANFGKLEPLTRFDAAPFGDYLWQRLFARGLAASDFGVVTGGGFRIARIPWAALQICGRFTARFGPPIYPRLDTRDYDVMIAETPYPASVMPHTRLIVRYHDAIPLLMPHTISDSEYHHATHELALRHNVRAGAWFACVSDATRQALVRIFPEAEPRSLTIHNMVAPEYFSEESPPGRVHDIIAATSSAATEALPVPAGEPAYLLMVSSIEPRKNHLALLAAWEELRERRFPDLRLLLVGGAGWHNEPIMRRFRPWLERGELMVLRNVTTADLRCLYRHARATVCPSYGEGFDYSGVEAMRSGGAVVASDIAVHREVYRDAAEYFNPYAAVDLARALTAVIAPDAAGRRRELVALGAAVGQRYLPERIAPQWEAFLRQSRSVS
jgi:glycosyltransferase involved in cell wall biosynthesis